MVVTVQTHECRAPDSLRPYLLLRPSELDAATVPTIIDLHGSGSWPEDHVAITGARSLAAAGAMVAVPQAGIPFRFLDESPWGWAWNVPGSPLFGETAAREEPDDLAVIDALITELIERHGVDPRRIHLRGYSGGARLAAHAMVALTSRLASVGCVSGLRFVSGAARPLPPLLAIHGRLDTLNPYGGDGGPRWGESVEAAASQWASVAGCHACHRTHAADFDETCYEDGTGHAAVKLIAVADAAHSWPGTTEREHIAQFGAPGTFSASDAHWNFVCEVERGAGLIG